MTTLPLGIGALGTMTPMSQGLLPPWVTWLWLVALTAVLFLHCGHLIRMVGQHRSYHASHVLMLVSMLYMYASMELGWTWLPSSWWVVIFSVSTAAVAGWQAVCFVQHRPFSLMWTIALIMQAAMIYMWLPDWVPALTWALVAYYVLETVAWLVGLPGDTGPAAANETIAPAGGSTPAGGSAPVVVAPPVPGSGSAGTGAGAGAGMVLVESRPATTVRTSHRAIARPLAHDGVTDRVALAVMAASMAYMFAAMQLMR